ncbi:hypothetical protein JFN88_12055, partial [Paenibacillus sp. MAHUQ-46]
RNIIFPIFNTYPLLTKKYYNFEVFQKCLFISENNELTKEEKFVMISDLIEKSKFRSNLSPIWLNSKENVISKPWLIGFIEAEGSFYITKKEKNRFVHGFGITQKRDSHVLENIRKILHISTKVKYNKYQFYSLDTTNSRAIENIIQYFTGSHNTNTKFKSIKGLEFRIWARSYIKHKGNFIKLEIIQKRMHFLKKKIKVE